MANHLAAADPCAAAAEADDLVHAAVRAVQEGRVPAELQEELVSSAQELLHRIDCPVAPPPTPEPPHPAPPPEADREDDADGGNDDDNGKGKDKDKGEGKGKGRDKDKDD